MLIVVQSLFNKFRVILFDSGRDIKPDNMGLSGDGQLRLLDLGLAVRLLRERGQRFPVWDCADYKRHAPRLRGARKIGTP